MIISIVFFDSQSTLLWIDKQNLQKQTRNLIVRILNSGTLLTKKFVKFQKTSLIVRKMQIQNGDVFVGFVLHNDSKIIIDDKFQLLNNFLKNLQKDQLKSDQVIQKISEIKNENTQNNKGQQIVITNSENQNLIPKNISQNLQKKENQKNFEIIGKTKINLHEHDKDVQKELNNQKKKKIIILISIVLFFLLIVKKVIQEQLINGIQKRKN